MNNTELQHWGIKGMRWGRRRYQNKDGSLTPAGRERYNDDDMDGAYEQGRQAAKKERTKRWVKIGAAAAVTALAIYGTKKYLDAKNSGQAEKGESAFKDVLEKLKTKKVDADDSPSTNKQSSIIDSLRKNSDADDSPSTNKQSSIIDSLRKNSDTDDSTRSDTPASNKSISDRLVDMAKKATNAESRNDTSTSSVRNTEPYWGKGESPVEAASRKRGLSSKELLDSVNRARNGMGDENDRKNLLALERSTLIAQKKSSTYGETSVGGMLAARKGVTGKEFTDSLGRARNGTGNDGDRSNLLSFEKSLRERKTSRGETLSVSDQMASKFGKTNAEIQNSLNKARNGGGDATDKRILMAFENALKRRNKQ